MDNVIDLCREELVGWYDSIDRLRVGGVLRGLQQAGAVVNFMKASYPGEERPLRHFSELTKRLTAGVDKLVRQGVPYMEAWRASDPAVQAWLEPLYAAGPRAGSVVAIVRTIEGVSSFSCRPRTHTRAKGDPRTGRRPTETAAHHLTRARHNIRVYYFYVFDAHWGRACVRLSSYLPFDITLQLVSFRQGCADPGRVAAGGGSGAPRSAEAEQLSAAGAAQGAGLARARSSVSVAS